MEKEFNVTGTCIPEMHYMIDISNKLDKVFKLVKEGKCFVISKKRKTFLEADGRLLFLAFISSIINGTGFAFKEVQGGEEKQRAQHL